jgi:hypothetical protein
MSRRNARENRKPHGGVGMDRAPKLRPSISSHRFCEAMVKLPGDCGNSSILTPARIKGCATASSATNAGDSRGYCKDSSSPWSRPGGTGGRLTIRLDLGIEGVAVDLGRHARAQLSRNDYPRHCGSWTRISNPNQAVDDAAIFKCIGEDKVKLQIIRDAAMSTLEYELRRNSRRLSPILEAYVA